MLERVKGMALELLEDGTHRGDRVALVAFRGGLPEATVALPLTRSVARARGGSSRCRSAGARRWRTPCAAPGSLLWRERYRHPNALPLVVAITDGAPTVPLRAGGDPLAGHARRRRASLRAPACAVVVADAATPGSPEALRGHARTIAEAARGTHVPLGELAPGLLAELLEERA